MKKNNITQNPNTRNIERLNLSEKLKDLLILSLLFSLILNKKINRLIEIYLPFFDGFTSPLPKLLFRGFIMGLLYLTIKKFISNTY